MLYQRLERTDEDLQETFLGWDFLLLGINKYDEFVLIWWGKEKWHFEGHDFKKGE